MLELTYSIHTTFWLLDIAITIFIDAETGPFFHGTSHQMEILWNAFWEPSTDGIKSIVAFKLLPELVHSIQRHSPHSCTSLHPLLRSLGLHLIFSLAPSLPSTTMFWSKVVATLNLCTYPSLWSLLKCHLLGKILFFPLLFLIYCQSFSTKCKLHGGLDLCCVALYPLYLQQCLTHRSGSKHVH